MLLGVIDDEAFKGCQTLTELVIPDKVEHVHWDAFFGCSGLKKLTIGRSVTSLDGGTFYGCDNIREVRSYIEEPFNVRDSDQMYDGVVQIGRCFPEVVTQEATLYVPHGSIEKYRSKQGWCDFVNISDTIETGVAEMSSPRNANSTHYNIYNINGQLLNAQPTKGIYIQNGKKIINNK